MGYCLLASPIRPRPDRHVCAAGAATCIWSLCILAHGLYTHECDHRFFRMCGTRQAQALQAAAADVQGLRPGSSSAL